jgi:hypothetical protein
LLLVNNCATLAAALQAACKTRWFGSVPLMMSSPSNDSATTEKSTILRARSALGGLLLSIISVSSSTFNRMDDTLRSLGPEDTRSLPVATVVSTDVGEIVDDEDTVDEGVNTDRRARSKKSRMTNV